MFMNVFVRFRALYYLVFRFTEGEIGLSGNKNIKKQVIMRK